MMMLSWVNDLLAGLISVLSETVGAILNIIWIILCQLVYPLVSLLFSLFTSLYSVDIIPKGSETILSDIYGRITIILTIVMTFYIVFEFVKYTVSPDKITDKEKGAMPLFVRIVIVILLLAFVPTIFDTAKTLQQRILDTNVIPKVILGTDYIDDDIAGVGREFVGDMFSAFIRVDCENLSLLSCEQLKSGAQASIDSVKEANFFMTTAAVQLDPGIEFSGLLALIFGCFMLYVVFLYCKDIALRHVQLLFLQVCAPIAIMSYIAPKKDGMFQKWVKQCLTTYLDLFIRIAILYFIILITKLLGETYQLDELRYAGDGGQINIFVYLFLVAGLLMFLKKVPKLLEELFPKSGAASIGFGFSAKDRHGILGGIGGITKGITNTAATAGKVIGAAAGVNAARKSHRDGKLINDPTGKMGRLKRARTIGEAYARAGHAGWKAGKDGVKAGRRAGESKVEQFEEVVSKGGTVLDFLYNVPSQREKAQFDLKFDVMKEMKEAKGDVNSAIGEVKWRKQMDSVAATLQANGHTDAKIAWDGEIKKFEKLARNYASGKITPEQYEQRAQEIVTKFNETYFPPINDENGTTIENVDRIKLNSADLETSTTKYQTITAKIKNAESVANRLAAKKIAYTVEIPQPDGTTITETRHLNMHVENGFVYNEDGTQVMKTIIDENGNQVQAPLTFADYIGDLTDEIDTAKASIESSDEYGRVIANIEGKK